MISRGSQGQQQQGGRTQIPPERDSPKAKEPGAGTLLSRNVACFIQRKLRPFVARKLDQGLAQAHIKEKLKGDQATEGVMKPLKFRGKPPSD